MIIRPSSLIGPYSRRDFIRIGSLAIGGLSLPKLLSASPARRDLCCIVIFQNGGSSQLDTFDPKPDAPEDIRGSFKSIPTTVPGIHLSELLPQTARSMKKFSSSAPCILTKPSMNVHGNISPAEHALVMT